MKARNENGTIVFYPTLPSQYKSDTLGLVLSGFETLPESVHQSEGFFEVVTPEYDPFTQELSPIFFDEAKQQFTYNIIMLMVPLQPIIVPKRLTKLEFVNRFTSAEFKNILAAAKSSPDIELWMMKFNLATYIDPNDPLTTEGIQGLEAFGLIGSGRANEILQ